MNIWKRICLKCYCCECCDGGTEKQCRKIYKVSLKRRARAMMKRMWKKEID